MKKLFYCFMLISILSQAQVGIGTTSPNGALDVTSTNEGMLIPRIALTATNVATVATPTVSEMIYNTATAGTTPNNVTPGFYFWNGTNWNKVLTGKVAWDFSGNSGTVPGTDFIGTTDPKDIRIKTNGIDRWNISNTNNGQLQSYSLGTAAAPTYSFQSNATTGIFSSGANTLNFSTNALERMTIVSDGRVSVNNTSPAAGDLFSATNSSSNPWTFNGYSNNNGSGVYGSVVSGSTVFAAVQGEYVGTSNNAAGIRGLNYSSTSGTNFTNSVSSGVTGSLSTSGTNYIFGVFGSVGSNTSSTSKRSGGVLGTDISASGALGYFANNGIHYSVYGLGNSYQSGFTTGKSSDESLNTTIGLGIYGGVVGGWIKGNEYGLVSNGERFSSYNMGKVISNEDYVVISGKETKIASYASTALQPEISSKGVSKLSNGQAFVSFDRNFSDLIDNSKPIIVTCTPMGESNGVFLAEVTPNGFKIKENNNGLSNVSFSWIAIAEKEIGERHELSKELLSKDFETNLTKVMHNDNEEGGKAIWSEKGEIKFGDTAPHIDANDAIGKEVEKTAKQKISK